MQVLAERQWKIVAQKKNYYLDFAIFCKNGKLAVETDDYTYHYDDRNQIDYQIQKAIEQLGGIEEPEQFERKVGERQSMYIIDGEEPL